MQVFSSELSLATLYPYPLLALRPVAQSFLLRQLLLVELATPFIPINVGQALALVDVRRALRPARYCSPHHPTHCTVKCKPTTGEHPVASYGNLDDLASNIC